MGFFKNCILKSVIGLLVITSFAMPCYAESEDAKYSSLVIDADTGAVLHQENAGKLRYPASLTKMMTLYLSFQALEQGTLTMNKQLRVSASAANQKPSVIGLRPGQTIAMQDAINAVIIKSANDAAVVLAEAVGGTESQFAALMTSTAKSLGMKNTTFANASGLPNNRQMTTAYDLARLAVALKRDYPQYYPLFSRASFTYNGRTIFSHNRVTKNYRGADGLKTGYIRASGFNLVTTAHRSGKSLVGVVMGGRSIKSRDTNMMKLLDQAFYNLSSGKVANSGSLDTNAVKSNASYNKQENSDINGNESKNDPVKTVASKVNVASAKVSNSTKDKEQFSRNVIVANEASFNELNEKADNSQPAPEVNLASYEQTASTVDIDAGDTIDDLKPKRVRVNGRNIPVPTFKPSGQNGGLVNTNISPRGSRQQDVHVANVELQ